MATNHTLPSSATPMYLIGQAADAAGIPVVTLKNWLNPARGVVLPGGGGGAKGAPRLFSLLRIYQIAITAELVRLGQDPSASAKAALKFSDTGAGSGKAKRRPGQLFEDGDTYLCVTPGGAARVVKVPSDLTVRELVSELTAGNPSRGLIMLNLESIVLSVRHSLGLPWHTDGEPSLDAQTAKRPKVEA
ncbi:MAG: hypothetical protein JWO33_17 [Caulobacteraceae bacterium]|nr:hypothetical protein [Caulobacteraceae bacterium]